MKEIHISEVRVGDTVLHEGTIKTVCAGDLRHNQFIGRTLFGDSYRLGYEKVLLCEVQDLKK